MLFEALNFDPVRGQNRSLISAITDLQVNVFSLAYLD